LVAAKALFSRKPSENHALLRAKGAEFLRFRPESVLALVMLKQGLTQVI
jgi:hypothetical protein